MPELLGDQEELSDRSIDYGKEDWVRVFTDYLSNYPHHPVLFGKAVDLRGNSREELEAHARWLINQIFAAADYDDRLARGEDANELRQVLSQ